MPGMQIDNAEFAARERVFGDARGTSVGVIDALNAELAIALEHIDRLEERKTQLESENLMLRHPDNCELLHHNLYEERARADAAPEAAGPFALSIPVKARLKVQLPFDVRTCISTRFDVGVLYCTMPPDTAMSPGGFPEVGHDFDQAQGALAAVAANHRGFWYRERGTDRVVIGFHAHIESVDCHCDGMTEHGAADWRVSGYSAPGDTGLGEWLPLHGCDMNAVRDHDIDGAQWTEMIGGSGGRN